jgi:FKBP-type peptidyl-prolyl cis-trans isomerase FkpA
MRGTGFPLEPGGGVRAVERKQIANVVVPAAAVAAVIGLVALVIVAGGPDEAAGKKKKDNVPVAATPSAAGMAEALPPLDAPEWKDIGDGLKIWDVKEGTGDPVPKGGSVTAHYTGWLTDGTVFDSSVKRGSPIPFSLDEVVAGWGRGIPGMKPGGIRRLYIPSELGYGSRGKGDIPPNATLVFEVKLISSP